MLSNFIKCSPDSWGKLLYWLLEWLVEASRRSSIFLDIWSHHNQYHFKNRHFYPPCPVTEAHNLTSCQTMQACLLYKQLFFLWINCVHWANLMQCFSSTTFAKCDSCCKSTVHTLLLTAYSQRWLCKTSLNSVLLWKNASN